MEFTLEYFDKINESYFNLEKNRLQGCHQFLKTENLSMLKYVVNEYIEESTILIKNLGKDTRMVKSFQISLNSIFRDKEFDEKRFFDTLESVTKLVDEKIDNFNIAIKGFYSDNNAAENYIDTVVSYNAERLNHMCEESLFLLSSLQNMHILTEADTNDDEKPGVKNTSETKSSDNNATDKSESNINTKEKVVAKGKSIASAVWDKLKEFFRNMKNMFINKIGQIRKRDGGWLKKNKSKINNIETEGIAVDIYSDIDKGFDSIVNDLNTISNKLSTIKIDSNAYENSKRITDRYRDRNGDLRQGMINYVRTGNAKNEPKLISIKGSQIPNTIRKMYDYCEEYLAKYSSIDKVIQKGEATVTKYEQEVKRRGVTEAFCNIEDTLYLNTELALCENYKVLLEADKPGVKDEKDPKVVASKMDNKSLSNFTKIVRDEQIILSATVTVLEARYFEYIKILKTLMK